MSLPFLLPSTLFNLMGPVTKPAGVPSWLQTYGPQAVGPVQEPQLRPARVRAAPAAWWSAAELEEDWARQGVKIHDSVDLA